MKNAAALLLLAVFLLTAGVIISCGDHNGEPAPQSTDPIITAMGTPVGTASNATIGTTGGTLQSADGKLTVIIPTGALSSSTTISIQPISNEGPLGVGFGYRLQPEGINFSKPVTLKFHYDEQLLKGIPADFLWIVTQTSSGSWNALLKSVVDPDTKTVTIETTHFSDWALGRFIDLSLTPSASTIQKGQSVELRVAGFVRDKALPDNEELVPLAPITGDFDALTPLTPIPPVESRLMDFKIKGWTLNGASAPVSNSNGSLTASKNNATYTSPNKKPTTNPVAVSVTLESNNKEGQKSSYMLTSSISVVDSDLYLLLKIDGQSYEYFQYGLNGTVPPDPNNVWLVNCGLDDDNVLGIVAGLYINSIDIKYAFGLQIENPSEGTRALTCSLSDGMDDMEFVPALGGRSLNIYNVKRKIVNDACDYEERCGDASSTFLTYTGNSNSIVWGYFSGKLYEDKPDYNDQCKSADEHTVEGEFRLVLIN